ncbi:hypothetical protein [Haloparvum sedimenti]|uniref:hypothetical protein n=1 Tax=Haloparvum sedimenti TaxID=1678448 RepID=UPI00071E71E6|nr:hypothetical protein [Haloparvum sedimenti]
MSVLDAVMWTVHVAFAALWTGSVLFVVATILPSATAGEIGSEAFGSIVDRLRWITRISAVAFLASGGHMAGTRYDVGTLTGTGNGHLVLTMLGLWVVLTGLVEVAGSKVESGVDEGKLREPARDAKPFFLAAAAVAVLLLITAGLLASNALA